MLSAKRKGAEITFLLFLSENRNIETTQIFPCLVVGPDQGSLLVRQNYIAF